MCQGDYQWYAESDQSLIRVYITLLRSSIFSATDHKKKHGKSSRMAIPPLVV